MSSKLLFSAMALCFAFALIGIASMLMEAEKHYTIQERHYNLNGSTVIVQKLRPVCRTIKLSWKNPLTKQEQI